MAEDMMSFYHGDEPGNTPGLLPDPYYCRSFRMIMHGMKKGFLSIY